MNFLIYLVFVLLITNKASAEYLQCYVCEDCEENEGYLEYCPPLEGTDLGRPAVEGTTQIIEVGATTAPPDGDGTVKNSTTLESTDTAVAAITTARPASVATIPATASMSKGNNTIGSNNVTTMLGSVSTTEVTTAILEFQIPLDKDETTVYNQTNGESNKTAEVLRNITNSVNMELEFSIPPEATTVISEPTSYTTEMYVSTTEQNEHATYAKEDVQAIWNISETTGTTESYSEVTTKSLEEDATTVDGRNETLTDIATATDSKEGIELDHANSTFGTELGSGNTTVLSTGNVTENNFTSPIEASTVNMTTIFGNGTTLEPGSSGTSLGSAAAVGNQSTEATTEQLEAIGTANVTLSNTEENLGIETPKDMVELMATANKTLSNTNPNATIEEFGVINTTNPENPHVNGTQIPVVTGTADALDNITTSGNLNGIAEVEITGDLFSNSTAVTETQRPTNESIVNGTNVVEPAVIMNHTISSGTQTSMITGTEELFDNITTSGNLNGSTELEIPGDLSVNSTAVAETPRPTNENIVNGTNVVETAAFMNHTISSGTQISMITETADPLDNITASGNLSGTAEVEIILNNTMISGRPNITTQMEISNNHGENWTTLTGTTLGTGGVNGSVSDTTSTSELEEFEEGFFNHTTGYKNTTQAGISSEDFGNITTVTETTLGTGAPNGSVSPITSSSELEEFKEGFFNNTSELEEIDKGFLNHTEVSKNITQVEVSSESFGNTTLTAVANSTNLSLKIPSGNNISSFQVMNLTKFESVHLNTTDPLGLLNTANGIWSNATILLRPNDTLKTEIADGNKTSTEEFNDTDISIESVLESLSSVRPLEAINSTNSLNIPTNASVKPNSTIQIEVSDGVFGNITTTEEFNDTETSLDPARETSSNVKHLEAINFTTSSNILPNVSVRPNDTIQTEVSNGMFGNITTTEEYNDTETSLEPTREALSSVKPLEAMNSTTSLDIPTNLIDLSGMLGNTSGSSKNLTLFRRPNDVKAMEISGGMSPENTAISGGLNRATESHINIFELAAKQRNFKQELETPSGVDRKPAPFLLEKYRRSRFAGQMKSGNITYKCYTVRVKGKNKVQINKGFVAVPEEETACSLLAKKYGREALEACQVCSGDKCNRSSSVGLRFTAKSLILIMLVGVLFY